MSSDPSAEAAGVDLGGTKMLTGVVGGDRQILHRSERASTGLGPDALVEVLVAELAAAVAARPAVSAVGLGVPFTIDRERGIAISAVNLPAADLPLREIIGERTGLPTFIDNDGNVAALAEQRLGAARGARNVVMLTIGTGIGGGLILNGEPFRGSTGAGAELGHIVIDADGPRCQGNCPNHGCVEALASGTALGREGERIAADEPDSALGRALAEGRPVNGRLVTELAIAGDPPSVQTVALIGRRIGVALSSLVNIFEPDVVVIGGGAMAAGELLLGAAREELRSRALRPNRDTPIVAAGLGPEAGMIGAALMAREEQGAAEVA